MKYDFADHGLPLVQLKEIRRDLVLSLQEQSGPIPPRLLAEIVNVQTAIKAVEAVVEDLDSELDGIVSSDSRAFVSGRA
jgi:hypothetical protein